MIKAHVMRATLAAALLAPSACAPIELVSQYDSQTDDAATAIQKDLTGFFVKISTAATSFDRTFAANQDFYKKEAVNISSMKVRAGAIPKNTITQQQLVLVEENIAYLALLNKGCITADLTKEQKDKVHEKGIDPSLDCRSDYGATADSPNRGDQALNPLIAKAVQDSLNIQIESILKFELAKKRGDKPTQGK